MHLDPIMPLFVVIVLVLLVLALVARAVRQPLVIGYLLAHDVPYNPLHDRGYPSIGCIPCTEPVTDDADPRSGRWANAAKTECGLHTSTKDSR